MAPSDENLPSDIPRSLRRSYQPTKRPREFDFSWLRNLKKRVRNVLNFTDQVEKDALDKEIHEFQRRSEEARKWKAESGAANDANEQAGLARITPQENTMTDPLAQSTEPQNLQESRSSYFPAESHNPSGMSWEVPHPPVLESGEASGPILSVDHSGVTAKSAEADFSAPSEAKNSEAAANADDDSDDQYRALEAVADEMYAQEQLERDEAEAEEATAYNNSPPVFLDEDDIEEDIDEVDDFYDDDENNEEDVSEDMDDEDNDVDVDDAESILDPDEMADVVQGSNNLSSGPGGNSNASDEYVMALPQAAPAMHSPQPVDYSEHEAEEYNPELSSMSVWEDHGFQQYDGIGMSPVNLSASAVDAANTGTAEIDGKDNTHLASASEKQLIPTNDTHEAMESPTESRDIEASKTSRVVRESIGFMFGPATDTDLSRRTSEALEPPHSLVREDTPSSQRPIESVDKHIDSLEKEFSPEHSERLLEEKKLTSNATDNKEITTINVPSNPSEQRLPEAKGRWNLFNVGFVVAPSVTPGATPDDLHIRNPAVEQISFEDEFRILSHTAHRVMSESPLFGGRPSPRKDRPIVSIAGTARASMQESPIQYSKAESAEDNQKISGTAHSLFAGSSLFGGNTQTLKASNEDARDNLTSETHHGNASRETKDSDNHAARKKARTHQDKEVLEDLANQQESPVDETKDVASSQPKRRRKAPARSKPLTRSARRTQLAASDAVDEGNDEISADVNQQAKTTADSTDKPTEVSKSSKSNNSTPDFDEPPRKRQRRLRKNRFA